MENNNNIVDLLKSAIPDLNKMVSADIVIGKEIKTDTGITIIPVSKVNFGYGMGGQVPSDKLKFGGGGAGGGITVTPVGFLVIDENGVHMMQISSAENTADRLVNMVPDVIDKVQGIVAKAKKDKEEKKAAEEQTSVKIDDIK